MIEVLKQARNAFVWNLNTDLDNIPACDQWAKMLRKNIDDLDKAIAELESQEPQGVQVSPKQFVESTFGNRHLVGRPVIWAEWPSREKNT